MFKWWSNYINGKVESRLDEIEEKKRLEKEEEERQQQALLEEERRKAEEYERQQRLAREKMKESDEPYIEVISERRVGDNIELKLDWNLAMINYLKANGFTGNSEEDIIYAYLRAIARNEQIEELANNYINEPEKGSFE